jgi:MFS family permease
VDRAPFWLAHRYDYGAGITGTLAALGLIGILCAPLAGSFSDRQGPFRMVVFGVILMLLAWIVFGAGTVWRVWWWAFYYWMRANNVY